MLPVAWFRAALPACFRVCICTLSCALVDATHFSEVLGIFSVFSDAFNGNARACFSLTVTMQLQRNQAQTVTFHFCLHVGYGTDSCLHSHCASIKAVLPLFEPSKHAAASTTQVSGFVHNGTQTTTTSSVAAGGSDTRLQHTFAPLHSTWLRRLRAGSATPSGAA